jgi:Raf kinase inhibitor-like YbhB/YbcL family protein
VVVAVVLALGVAACGGDDDDTTGAASNATTSTSTDAAAATSTPASDDAAGAFTLTSVFADGDAIPTRFTCDGENVSPPLRWSNVPAGATQLALIFVDKDGPGGEFVHWLLWGFPAETGSLQEGKIPYNATTGKNSANSEKYIGPCPPKGTHRYVFELHALSDAPQLPIGADVTQLRDAIAPLEVATAELSGTYSRG